MLETTYPPTSLGVIPRTTLTIDIEAMERLLQQTQPCSLKILDLETKQQILSSLVGRMRHLRYLHTSPSPQITRVKLRNLGSV